MMQGRYRVMLGLVLIVVFADQLTKEWATQYLRLPSRSCTRGQAACLLRCDTLPSSKPSSQATTSPCHALCEKELRLCREAEQKEEELHQSRLAKLRSLPLCREVRQPWPGAKPVCVVFPGIFHLQYEFNPGTALGMFGELPSWFRRTMFFVVTIFAMGFILFLFRFRITEHNRLMIWGLSSVMAGAIGNFMDRIRFNYVVDFLDVFLPLGQGRVFHIPTFNIADIAISVGVGLILLDAFLPERSNEPPTSEGRTPLPSSPSGEPLSATPPAPDGDRPLKAEPSTPDPQTGSSSSL